VVYVISTLPATFSDREIFQSRILQEIQHVLKRTG